MVEKNLSDMTLDNEKQLLETFYPLLSESSYGSVLVNSDEKNFEALCRGDKTRVSYFLNQILKFFIQIFLIRRMKLLPKIFIAITKPTIHFS